MARYLSLEILGLMVLSVVIVVCAVVWFALTEKD